MTDIRDPHRRTGALDGRCLCGAVTLAVRGGHVAAVGACHCLMCQRWSGALYATFDAEADAVAVSGPVGRYQSTPWSERAFCATCGSHLWLRNTDATDAPYELLPGLFRDAGGFPLLSEIYVDRRPGYLPLSGDHRTKTREDYERDNPAIEGDDP